MTDHVALTLTAPQWNELLSSLYERGERLEKRQPGHSYPPEEKVDAYVMSGHAEALWSDDLDGDIWGTLEDLETGETADTEAQAWSIIKAFYLERGCVLVRAGDDEWIFSAQLLRRLGWLASGVAQP
ncbi:hypothetical protein ACFP81_04420 [Deinococcus lacus]|uniref:Uncharacterized protein n=1 Tax=Deinococcus lacus TaxID=392561 RepID=A0ABW1YDL3_9DEIO